MTELNFEQYQEVMKPITDLIEGIVKIVGYDTTEEEREISTSLINQLFLSVIIMHISQSKKGKDLPDSSEINSKLESGNGEKIVSELTSGITKDDLTKYLSESATLVMTNYYYEVKDVITPEKTQQIQKLYEKIQEGI